MYGTSATRRHLKLSAGHGAMERKATAIDKIHQPKFEAGTIVTAGPWSVLTVYTAMG